MIDPHPPHSEVNMVLPDEAPKAGTDGIWTLQSLAQHLGWGRLMTDAAIWQFAAEREGHLRAVQDALETRKSDAGTAREALLDRINALCDRAEAGAWTDGTRADAPKPRALIAKWRRIALEHAAEGTSAGLVGEYSHRSCADELENAIGGADAPTPAAQEPKETAEAIVKRVAAYVRGFYPPPPSCASGHELASSPWKSCQHIAEMIEAQSFSLIQSATLGALRSSPADMKEEK